MNSDLKIDILMHSERWRGLLSLFLVAMAIYFSGCSLSNNASDSADYTIPDQSDWIDYGPIFEQGELGEWDYQLYGGFTNTVVKKDDIFYLYYQGASGYRVDPDETVTWRAIGVATSPDGINFTKSANNPILTWFPNDNGEEGVTSGAAAKVVLYS